MAPSSYIACPRHLAQATTPATTITSATTLQRGSWGYRFDPKWLKRLDSVPACPDIFCRVIWTSHLFQCVANPGLNFVPAPSSNISIEQHKVITTLLFMSWGCANYYAKWNMKYINRFSLSYLIILVTVKKKLKWSIKTTKAYFVKLQRLWAIDLAGLLFQDVTGSV